MEGWAGWCQQDAEGEEGHEVTLGREGHGPEARCETLKLVGS